MREKEKNLGGKEGNYIADLFFTVFHKAGQVVGSKKGKEEEGWRTERNLSVMRRREDKHETPLKRLSRYRNQTKQHTVKSKENYR